MKEFKVSVYILANAKEEASQKIAGCLFGKKLSWTIGDTIEIEKENQSIIRNEIYEMGD